MELRFQQKPIVKFPICELPPELFKMPAKLQISNIFLRKGNKTDRSNYYRPIFLLPLISKILERAIHDQTDAFLKGNK